MKKLLIIMISSFLLSGCSNTSNQNTVMNSVLNKTIETNSINVQPNIYINGSYIVDNKNKKDFSDPKINYEFVENEYRVMSLPNNQQLLEVLYSIKNNSKENMNIDMSSNDANFYLLFPKNYISTGDGVKPDGDYGKITMNVDLLKKYGQVNKDKAIIKAGGEMDLEFDAILNQRLTPEQLQDKKDYFELDENVNGQSSKLKIPLN